MRGALWLAILSTCLLGVTVESVIIRDWRSKAKMVPGNVTDPDQTAGPAGTRSPRRKKGFRPTESRCCKIGEKVAKRKLACDVEILEVLRHYNDLQRAKMKYNRPRKLKPSKISAKLSSKLRKCSATFPKYFEKCCKYRQQFYKSMSKCKRRQGKERRKCRQSVRRRYKAPSAAQRKVRRRNGQ